MPQDAAKAGSPYSSVGRLDQDKEVAMFPEKHRARPKRKHVNLRQILLYLSSPIFVVLLAGCGGQTDTTVTPPIRTAPTVIAERGDEEWDYVALGDSITWGMPDRYAAMMEQDLGVTVIVHGKTVANDLTSRLLERLRTDTRLRQDLREAEVITLQIPFSGFAFPMTRYMNSPAACGGVDNQDCLREALEAFKEDVEGIIDEIVSLRSPSEALIRTQDMHPYYVTEQKEAGAFEVTDAYWREANAHITSVASGHRIPVAQVYDAFAGESGAEDPRNRGLVSDGAHTTPKGAALMAECFRELGYEYAPSNNE
jgi:lysophospholipase L1-like esterase